MPNFAIYEKDIILNVIIADNKEDAEEITGMNAIEVEDIPWIGWSLIDNIWSPPNEEPWIGWIYLDGKWRPPLPPSPFPSWTWNGEYWVAPVPMPQDGKYRWDEDTLSWIKIEEEEV